MLLVQLIIIQMITFLVLVFVLRKILYKSSSEEVSRLQRLNDENAKKAQELAQKIEEAEKTYEQKLNDTENEMRKLKAHAQEEADKLKEEILEKARHESERIIEQALNTKERVREEIQAQMLEKSIDMACQLAQEVLLAKSQKLLHETAVDEVIAEIEKVDAAKLKVTTSKGQITTPFPLDSSRSGKIQKTLSEKTGKAITLEEKQDKEIIAGIIIKLGSIMIDGSLRGKIQEAAEAMWRKS